MHRTNAALKLLPKEAQQLVPTEHGDSTLSGDHHHVYRIMIGGLLYLTLSNWTKLPFLLSNAVCQVHAPMERHMKLLKRLFRYLN